MKRFILIFILFLSSIFLCGCIDLKIDQEITIFNDKNITHSMKILTSDNVIYFREEIENRLISEFKKAGFTDITRVNDANYFGICGIKNNNLEEVKNDFNNNNLFSIDDRSIDYFFFKHISVNVNFKLGELLHDEDKNLISLSEYKFTLNLPVKIINSNADNLLNNGKSAVWYLSPYETNNIYIECIVYNYINIAIITFIFLLSIIFSIIVIIKNNQCSTMDDNEPINVGLKSLQKDNIKNNICPNCKQKISTEDIFCGNCGYQLKKIN